MFTGFLPDATLAAVKPREGHCKAKEDNQEQRSENNQPPGTPVTPGTHGIILDTIDTIDTSHWKKGFFDEPKSAWQHRTPGFSPKVGSSCSCKGTWTSLRISKTGQNPARWWTAWTTCRQSSSNKFSKFVALFWSFKTALFLAHDFTWAFDVC